MIRVTVDGSVIGVKPGSRGVKVRHISGPPHPWAESVLRDVLDVPLPVVREAPELRPLMWQVQQLADSLGATSVVDDGKDWGHPPKGAHL